MTYLRVLVALVVTIAGCAGQTGSSSVSTATGGQRLTWQQHMDQARRFAAAGMTYELRTIRGIYVFYNNPRPFSFCYTYMVPGDWEPGEEPGLFRPRVGKAYGAHVGVLFVRASDLEGFKGSNLPERAGTAITRDYEKKFGQPLTGVELVPFESPRPGTRKWKAAPVVQGGQVIMFPTKVIVDLSPDAVAVVTVGLGDEDALARHVIETVRTTREPECYFPVLEKMLKTGLGER